MKRWTAKRKIEVLDDLRAERYTVEEALTKHDVSAEELARWLDLYERHGLRGLKVRTMQAVQPRKLRQGVGTILEHIERHRQSNRKKIRPAMVRSC
jgi:transposase-like protein